MLRSVEELARAALQRVQHITELAAAEVHLAALSGLAMLLCVMIAAAALVVAWGLLVACVLAHLVSTLILRRDLLSEKVARRGFHVNREYELDPLRALAVRDVMDAAPRTVDADLDVRELARRMPNGSVARRQRLYPVIGSGGAVLMNRACSSSEPPASRMRKEVLDRWLERGDGAIGEARLRRRHRREERQRLDAARSPGRLTPPRGPINARHL